LTTTRKQMQRNGSSGSGSVDQGGIHRALVVAEKTFRGKVRNIEWAVTHVKGCVRSLGLGGDVIAWDNGRKAVSEFGKVKDVAVAVQNLQGMGEGTGFGAGVDIDGGTGGDVNVLLAVFRTTETESFEVAVGGGGGEN